MLIDELKTAQLSSDTRWLSIYQSQTPETTGHRWSQTWIESEKLEKLTAFEEYIKNLEREEQTIKRNHFLR